MTDPSFHPVFAERAEESLQCCVASIYGFCKDAVPCFWTQPEPHIVHEWTYMDAMESWVEKLRGQVELSRSLRGVQSEWSIAISVKEPGPVSAVYRSGELWFVPWGTLVEFQQLEVQWWASILDLSGVGGTPIYDG